MSYWNNHIFESEKLALLNYLEIIINRSLQIPMIIIKLLDPDLLILFQKTLLPEEIVFRYLYTKITNSDRYKYLLIKKKNSSQ